MKEGLGVVVVRTGAGLGWAPNLRSLPAPCCSLMRPMLMFPAKLGTVLRSPELEMILGTRRSLAVFLLRMASAVLFLLPPMAPGHPSHPSLVSRRSP